MELAESFGIAISMTLMFLSAMFGFDHFVVPELVSLASHVRHVVGR